MVTVIKVNRQSGGGFERAECYFIAVKSAVASSDGDGKSTSLDGAASSASTALRKKTDCT